MKELLSHLFNHNNLTKEEAKSILVEISEGKHNETQVAAFISVFLMRNISVEELTGFRDALLELRIPLDFGDIDAIDLCGTGGDGKNTFNISTLTSLIVSGAGYNVTKHGNYGVSSVCGSSNVLENLGYKFTNDPEQLKKQLEKANICFLHAPLFHPAMKFVGPIRRQLGVKTFFNMLGPLVNPARPNHQMTGVFSLHLQRLYQYLFEQSNMKYTIVYGLSGFDEISLTDNAKVITNRKTYLANANTFSLPKVELCDIYGGATVDEAANIFMKVLDNKGDEAQKNVVLANAALAIKTFEENTSIEDCLAKAKESMESGSAKNSFKQIVQLSQST